MATQDEVLVFGCRDDDVTILAKAVESQGPTLRNVSSGAEFARLAVSCRPLAVIVGVGTDSVGHLDVIAAVRAIRESLRVIVIADEDSLDLERSARERNIFYYVVSPVDEAEVTAVLQDVLRSTKD